MKRLISALLTIAMLLTLVPAAFAEGTTSTLEKSGVKIVYDLSKVIVDNSGTLLDSARAKSFAKMSYAMTNGFFKFVDGGKIDADGFMGGTSGIGGKIRMENRDGVGGFVALSKSSPFALEIFVPKAGSYTFEMYAPKTAYVNSQGATPAKQSAKGTVVNVYLSKNGVSTVTGDFQGSYATWDESVGTASQYVAVSEPQVLEEKIEIPEAGKYTITFNSTCEDWVYNTIGTFVLNGGDNLIPMMSTCEIAKDTLAVGEKAQITAEAEKLSDGSDATGVTYSYASAASNIAEVDENGVVTAKAVGDTEITVVATCNGQSASEVIPVSVIPDGAAGINLTYNIGTHIPTWGSSTLFKDRYSYDNEKDLLSYYTDSEEIGKHANGYFRCYHDQQPPFICIDQREFWWAATIRVPVSGKYSASVNIAKRNSNTGALGVYLIEKNSELGIAEITSSLTAKNRVGNIINQMDTTLSGMVPQADPASLGVVDIDAGEYYLVFKNDGNRLYAYFGDFFLKGYGDGVAPIITTCGASETLLEKGESADITTAVRYLTDGNEASNVAYTYESSDENVAEVDVNGSITAKNGGNATITVSATADGATLPGTRTIDITVNTPEYTEAFGEDTYEVEENVNVNPEVGAVAYADGTALSGANADAEKNADGTYSVVAEETVGEYTFRYWVRGLEDASGNKRIVSLENNFTYAPQKGDKNWLIAVYTKNGTATTEYFNANGQLIPDGTLPVMPGYGKATGWKDHGNGIKEAVYGNIESYLITVNGKEKSYNYGEAVPCTASAEKNGQHFLGWTKLRDGETEAELVSADLDYTFYAWEKCTVEAVYVDDKPVFTGYKRKILVDTFSLEGETAVMAEFIGFDDAVERGITLGSKDYTMTSKTASQFTIINDVGAATAEISGYAILADGTKLVYNLE